MSILIAHPKGSPVKIGDILSLTNGKDRFGEIGLGFSFGNEVNRRINFNCLSEVIAYIEKYNIETFIIYANNGFKTYGDAGYSPQQVSDDYLFAACGNILSTGIGHWGKSNTQVLNEQVLQPAVTEAPRVCEAPYFAWMLRRIAREYIGMAFLSREGQIILINNHLFKEYNGLLFIDFDTTKKQVTTKVVQSKSKKNEENVK